MLNLATRPSKVLRLMDDQLTSFGIDLPLDDSQIWASFEALAGEMARIVEKPITEAFGCD